MAPIGDRPTDKWDLRYHPYQVRRVSDRLQQQQGSDGDRSRQRQAAGTGATGGAGQRLADGTFDMTGGSERPPLSDGDWESTVVVRSRPTAIKPRTACHLATAPSTGRTQQHNASSAPSDGQQTPDGHVDSEPIMTSSSTDSERNLTSDSSESVDESEGPQRQQSAAMFKGEATFVNDDDDDEDMMIHSTEKNNMTSSPTMSPSNTTYDISSYTLNAMFEYSLDGTETMQISPIVDGKRTLRATRSDGTATQVVCDAYGNVLSRENINGSSTSHQHQ